MSKQVSAIDRFPIQEEKCIFEGVMTTNILKSELTKAIAGINDKALLEALFTIVNRAEHVEDEYEISEEDWKIVEARSRQYKAGKAKGITMGEMRKRITKKLSA